MRGWKVGSRTTVAPTAMDRMHGYARLPPPRSRVPGINPSSEEANVMAVLLVVLLVVLLLGGAGFAFHLLWFIAALLLVAWLLGFLFRGTGTTGARGRWYRW